MAKQCASSYGSILFAFFYFSGSFWCILLLQLYEVNSRPFLKTFLVQPTNISYFVTIESNFQHKKFIQTNDFVLLLIVITTTVAFLPFFFLICHFGENVTTAFAKLNVSIYDDIPWYLCPVNVQKCVGPMLMASHTPFHFRGIASLKCSHETFKKVGNYSNKNKTQSLRQCLVKLRRIKTEFLMATCLYFVWFRLSTRDIHILWCFVASIQHEL